MKISVYIDDKNENRTVELDEGLTVDDLLEKVNVNPVTVVVTRDDELITGSAELKDNDKLKVLSVVSGG